MHNKEAYLERVKRIVRQVTKRDVENFDLKGELKDQLRLDSIQIVELFAALENEFNIELPLQMMTVKNTEEFMEILIREIEKY